MSLQELESAVARLSLQELAQFKQWLDEFFAEESGIAVSKTIFWPVD